jgi:hypothetical protein
MGAIKLPASIRNWQPPRRIRHRYRERFGLSYWHSLYGTDCPLPRLTKWRELPGLLERIDVATKGRELAEWWTMTKLQSQACVRAAVEALRASYAGR